MSGTTKPFEAYIRVSDVGLRDVSGVQYQTENQQTRAIQEWAAKEGTEIRWNPAERDVSGGTIERPILSGAIARIASGESAGIVSFTLDRLTRDMLGGLTILSKISEAKGKFVSTSEPEFNFSSDDPMDIMKLHFNLMMAQYYRAAAAKRWSMSVNYAVERGAYTGRGTPFGYVKDDEQRLQPGEHAGKVKEIYQRRARGDSDSSIATWLNEVAPLDEGVWTGAAVARLVARKVYLGYSIVDGPKVKVENKEAHEPLIDELTWKQAQGASRTWARLEGDDVPLLGGLVRCSGCRYLASRSVNRSEGRERAYYRCRCKRESGTCLSPASIRGDGEQGLEAFVDRVMCEVLDERFETLSLADQETDLAEALEELEAASIALDEFRLDDRARERLGPDRWMSFLEPLLNRLDEAQARVAELSDSGSGATPEITSEEYLSLSVGGRSNVIAAFVDAIMVRKVGPQGNKGKPIDGSHVRILWRGEGETWPLRGKSGSIECWHWPE